MGRKITILGMGPTAYQRSIDIAKYCEGTEIWGVNNGYLTFPDLRINCLFDRMFELHKWEYLRTFKAGEIKGQGEIDHWSELQRLGCEVVTGQHIPLVQKQTQLDWEGVFAHFNIPVYFLGSPSIVLALALYEHDHGNPIEYLQSWGIDTSDPQHGQQRASWAFWMRAVLDRGIRVGGTALEFMNEYENDTGLQGYRELIRDRIASRRKVGEITDYAVAAFCTDDGYYRPKFDRLKSQAEALGLPFVGRVFPVPEGKTSGEVAKEFPASIIRELLAEAGKPILYMDCDDELLARPSFPKCEIGIARNPEVGQIDTHLACAPWFFVVPGQRSEMFLRTREEFMAQVNGHRALNTAWMMLRSPSHCRCHIEDVSDYVKGCIQYNPSPVGHRPQTLRS